MQTVKSFEISRQLVWQAYLRVKANKGSAGIDQVTLTDFEKDLKGNLYKIWNRMSSGSYMPPPVKLVEIPKSDGKTRPLRYSDSRGPNSPDGGSSAFGT